MHFFKYFLLTISFFTLSLHANEASLEKVTLQLQWKHQFEFAGFYAAKEKGFYDDVGLDVSFVEFDGKKSITDEVLNGNAEYGLGYSSIIAEYLEGKPLVLLANFFKQSPLVLVVQKEIQTPSDLKGKKVMGVSDSIHNITLLTMLSKFDIGRDDIINIPASFDINDFISRKVDAMSVFTTNELYYLDKKGIKYNLFDPVVYGAKYYDANLFTSEKELSEHPERAKKFREASIKGWEYALAHPEEIINIIIDNYNPQNKSKEALKFEAKQIEHIMLPTVHEVGSVDVGRINAIAENFIQAGFLDNIKYKSLEKFIYGSRAEALTLTTEEKLYLLEKKSISLCIHPDWMPFEKIEKGKHIGISADYIEFFQSKIGIPIKLHTTQTWSESLQNIKNRTCDIVPLAMNTPSTKAYMHTTSPYIDLPLVVATTNDKLFISDISELAGKRIGIVKRYEDEDKLKNKYDDVIFVDVETLNDGLRQVVEGKLFGLIENLSVVGYEIQHNFPNELKITGRINEVFKPSVGIRNDEPLLLNIFQKAIGSLDNVTRQTIMDKWVPIKYEPNSNIKLFWFTTIVILLMAFILLISYIILRKYNESLKEEVAQKVEELRKKDEILIKKHRMSEMGELLSMIAHQWRQPLAAINSALMGVEVKLESDSFDFESKTDRNRLLAYLKSKHKKINEYVQHLSSTTDDFRNFFNPNKTLDDTSLTTVIKNALNIIELPMQEKGIKITTDFQDSTKLPLYQNEVMQVVLNILKNSEDNFTIENTRNPKISISTRKDKNLFIIRICDNGGGIPEDIKAHVFDPYFTTKDEKNGSGLGLYMSNLIVEKHHNGKLTFENNSEGTCFYVQFTFNI